jgi:hypothetical protein
MPPVPAIPKAAPPQRPAYSDSPVAPLTAPRSAAATALPTRPKYYTEPTEACRDSVDLRLYDPNELKEVRRGAARHSALSLGWCCDLP